MAWYNPLTWSDKIIDNVLDKDDGLLKSAGGWIDNLSHTDQEQAEDKKELRKAVVAYAVTSMNENSERSKARREIAKIWIKVQLWLIMLTATAIPLDDNVAKSYFELATSSIMLGGTGAIITFFFGSYMLTRHNETKSK